MKKSTKLIVALLVVVTALAVTGSCTGFLPVIWKQTPKCSKSLRTQDVCDATHRRLTYRFTQVCPLPEKS